MDKRERYAIMYNENHAYDDLEPFDYCRECEKESTRFDVFVKVDGKERCFSVCYECGHELEEVWA